MKLEWLQPLATNTRHICVVDQNNNVQPICDTTFFTKLAKPDGDSKVCVDCQTKWSSGEEIAIRTKDGGHFVVRKAGHPVWKGSLDPFQDMAEAMSKMNVAYMLVVAYQGETRTRYWTNLQGYSHETIEAFRKQSSILADRINKMMEDKEKSS